MKKQTDIAQAMKKLADDLCRIYDNENFKRYKRSEEEMTAEEYNEKLHRDNKRHKITLIAVAAAVIAGYIAIVIAAAVRSSLPEAALSAGLMLCALVLVYLLAVHPLLVRPYLVRRRLFELLDSENRTVFDDDIYEFIDEKVKK